MSAGIAAWSVDMIRKAGATRLIGAIGIGVAVLPVVAIAAGVVRLDVGGMMEVVGLQAIWNASVALQLLSRTPASARDIAAA